MAVIPENTSIPIRADLSGAIDEVWTHLGGPGTWLTGEQRVAVIEETRNAFDCAFCARCREALSPFSENSDHEHLGKLPAPLIDVVHRLVTDPGRLTKAWYQSIIDAGVAVGEYIETAAIVSDTIAIDSFHRALSLPLPALPEARPGEPTRETPDGLETKVGWVPMVNPRHATGEIAEAWWPDGERGFVPNVRKSMSYVPKEAIAFIKLSSTAYLDNRGLNDFKEERAITRPQMELLAAKTSALNECFY